jgi:hypothetical protein
MLRSLLSLEGYTLEARDGAIGHCHDFLFDDRDWAVRYMVAATGRWLTGRKVLISPAFLDRPDWETQRFPVDLTQRQIEEAPPLDADAPVSRRYEQAYHTFFSLFPYWAGSSTWANNPDPSGILRPVETPPLPAEEEESGAVHLRSAREIAGYHLAASDERAGRVADFLVNDHTWAIHAVVVKDMPLVPGHQVLVPAARVESIDWAGRELRTTLSAEAVRQAEPFDPDQPLSAESEIVLYDAHGRPRGHGGPS